MKIQLWILLLSTLIYIPGNADQVSIHIPLDPDRIIDLTGTGGAYRLADEQEAVGDPRAGTGTQPGSGWRPGWSDRYYPAEAILDLGGLCHLTDVYFYDGAGQGLFEVEARVDGDWVLLVSDHQERFNRWIGVSVDVTARYLRVRAHGKNIIPNEVMLYGSRLEEIEPLPEPVPHTPPTIDAFMGINAFVNDPFGRLQAFGTVREYSDWGWIAGNNLSGPVHPNEEHRFERSYVGNWNFDLFYANLARAEIETVICRQATALWLGVTDAQHKPIPPDSGRNPEDPASYLEHAEHMFQVAARYGSAMVDDALLKLGPDEPRLSGLGTVRYLENWNEPEKTWHGDAGYFSPAAFAAMSSADADGHLGTMGSHVGMKNADPDIQFVMGGLIGINIPYIRAMQWWFDEHRNGDFPFDVLNVHHYSNDAGGQFTNRTRGISPEADDLRGRMEALRDLRDRFYPGREIWITEFGYDVHPDSTQNAPAIGSLSAEEVQGAWIIRSFLALAAAGTDRAHLYMLRDASTGNSTNYSTSGLITDRASGFMPRPAWYYCFAMREHLRGLRYHSDGSADTEDITVYRFADDSGTIRAYAVWSPTEEDRLVENVTIPVEPGSGPARIVELAEGEPLGVVTPVHVVNDTVTLTVSEIPRFLLIGPKRTVRPPDQPLDLSGAAVVLESGRGDPSMLFDEFTEAGDPALYGEAAGSPENTWSPGFNFPVSAYVYLGEERGVSAVYLYDTNNEGLITIQVGEPGDWRTVSSDPLRQFRVWSPHIIRERTRYLRFIREAGANISEAVVYLNDQDFSSLPPADSLLLPPFSDWISSFPLSVADQAPDADPTGNGLTNYAAYLWGLDPTDHSDRFRLNAASLTFSPEEASVSLPFEARPGRRYTLERSQDLEQWTPVSTLVPGWPGEALLFDTHAPEDIGFYRLKVMPVDPQP